MEKTNEALKTYLGEMTRLRKMISSSTEQDKAEGETGMKEVMKKALKCQSLEDDNKRLRKTLK